MRIAVISDIHGNLPALEAVLQVLARERVDRYVCAGDVVGYGPFPNECAETVASLHPVWVAGNHDLMAVGLLGSERCVPIARETMAWTRTVLSDRTRAMLAALPLRLDVTEGVAVAHGSFDDPEEYVRTAEQAARQIAHLNSSSRLPTVLLGHTHIPWIWSAHGGAHMVQPGRVVRLEEASVLNPGAVGQSRDRRALACFALLDLGRREVSFHGVTYDTARCREELRRHGLPDHAYHLPPSRLRRLRRCRQTVRRGTR